jgi:hypothetical protein
MGALRIVRVAATAENALLHQWYAHNRISW